MMQKSTTFTTNFRAKKCYFHYDYDVKIDAEDVSAEEPKEITEAVSIL
jgi:hypothetical protein